MKQTLTSLGVKLKRNWGLIGLLAILNLFFFSEVFQPGAITGWDNFTVSQNLGINFLRTLFSTWREYRGLGVPSDSEVVDVFRQSVLWPISLFFPNIKIDLVYYFMCLTFGVVTVYQLSKELLFEYSNKSRNENHSHFTVEGLAFLAGAFHFFSLFTIGIFYVPITMYVTRYALYPMAFLLVWRLFFKREKKTLLNVGLAGVTFLFGSAAYLTSTVFLTLCLFLGLILIFKVQNFLKILLFFFCLLALNSFWLLPFANYVFQKAALVSEASTFIEVNQIQLNAAPTQFSFTKLVTGYPSFFYTQVTSLSENKVFSLHPLHDFFQKNPFTFNLLLLPLIPFVVGCLFAIKSIKKERFVFSLVVVFLISIFFLRKEYPPLGFMYDWLSTNIPFLRIVFRFGGEKFYPTLQLSLVLLSILGLNWLIDLSGQIKLRVLRFLAYGFNIILLGLPTLVIFASFITVGFFSPHTRTVVPDAYQRISQIINNDPDFVRVLQLPFDQTSYWKVYNWGYVGSSFFNFQINKPFLDKTFEPASLENDAFSETVENLLLNSQQVSGDALNVRALKMAELFKKTQTKYVLLDNSVNVNATAKNIRYFGNFPLEETQTLLFKMKELGLINEKEVISLAQSPTSTNTTELILYEVNDIASLFGSEEKATALTSNEIFSPDLLFQTTYQEEFDLGRYYPFLERKQDLSFDDNNVTFSTELQAEGLKWFKDRALVNETDSSQQVVSIEALRQGSQVKIKVIPFASPVQASASSQVATFTFPNNFEAQPTSAFLNNWHVLPNTQISQYRILVNDQVIPLPVLSEGINTSVATVLLDTNNEMELKLLIPQSVKKLPTASFALTREPNCFNDKENGYLFDASYTLNELRLTSLHGTTCIFSELLVANEQSDYFEAKFDYNLAIQPSKVFPVLDTASRWQQTIDQTLKNLPENLFFTVCIINLQNAECSNSHRVLSSQTNQIIVTPEIRLPLEDAQILLTLPTQNDSLRTLTLNEVELQTYAEELPTNVSQFQPELDQSQLAQIETQSNLKIDLPYVISPYSYFYQPGLDALQNYTGTCGQPDGYSSMRTWQNAALGYVHGCNQGMFTILPFSSKNLTLWGVDYHLLSGKQPQFSLKGQARYVQEYLDRNEEYPALDLPKVLQLADPLGDISQEKVKEKMGNLSDFSSFVTIPPQAVEKENNSLVFDIQQQSENQGIYQVTNMNIMPLPSDWQQYYLENQPSERNFDQLVVTDTQKWLPSLWRVTVRKESSSGNDSLLSFNQAFDSQWQLLADQSLFGVLLNQGQLPVRHVKFNQWANAWILPADLVSGEETSFWFFYAPERLALLGWSITVLTLIGGGGWLLRQHWSRKN